MYFQFGRAPGHTDIRRAAFCTAKRGCSGLVIALSLFTLPAIAGQDIPLTLAAAEDLALAAEPGRQAIQARAEVLQERAVIAGELPDPMLRVGLNNFPIESGGFSTEGMTNIGVGVRQAFPAGRTRALSAHKFSLLADVMNENADARYRNVLMTTREVWLDLYYWRQAHEMVLESRPFFTDLAAITRSLYAVGRKSQQDVLRAELELSRLDDRLIDIERQQSRARAQLAEWIGQDAERPIARKLPDWQQVPLRDALESGLLQHPTLRAADSQIEAGDAGIELAKQRSRPAWALDVGYSYRRGMLPSGQSRSDLVTLGVTVGLPFFSKKSVDSTLAAALHERTAARSDREQALRALRSQLVAEHTRWQDLSRRLTLYDTQILGQARDHAEASLLAYQSDRGDFGEVMRAYITDLNTRIEHVRLQVERAQSYAALANLGGMPR